MRKQNRGNQDSKDVSKIDLVEKKMNIETRRTLTIIFVTLILDLLAFTLILPLMPKLIDHYKRNDTSGYYDQFQLCLQKIRTIFSIFIPSTTLPSGSDNNHNYEDIQDDGVLFGGLLGSWFSLLQFLSAPMFGALSDSYGRKIILLIALSATLLSHSLWYLSYSSFALFLLARTIAGLSKCNISLSLAIVTDVSNEQQRGKAMALVGAAFSLAFIVGPLFGALLSSRFFDSSLVANSSLIQVPAFAAFSLSLLNLIIVQLYLPETNSSLTNESSTHKSSTGWRNVLNLVNPVALLSFKAINEKNTKNIDRNQMERLKRLGVIYFLYLIIYSGLEFTLAFLTHIRFKFSSMDQGKLYLFSGLIMAALQGGYIRRVSPGQERKLATFGLAIVVPSFAIMGLATNVAQIYISLIFYAISSAIVVPCLTALVSSCCHNSRHKGVTLGIFRSIGALARSIGPGLSSICFWSFGATLTYCLGSLLIIAPLILMFDLSKVMQQLIITKKEDKQKENRSRMEDSEKIYGKKIIDHQHSRTKNPNSNNRNCSNIEKCNSKFTRSTRPHAA